MIGRKIKTIIVDDESRIRRGIEKLVLSCGEDWEVVASFGDGQELLNAFTLEPIDFDVLLTDVKMPVLDGLSLIKELKKLASFSPIVISGFEDFSFLQTALREGALDYIMKPIDREEFKEQLDSVKEKIKKEWAEQDLLEVIKEQATKVSVTLQTEKLREMMSNKTMEQFEWSNDFPQGSYVLLFVSIDRALSHSRSILKEEWNRKINMYGTILDDTLKECNVEYWKWRDEGSSFWILLFFSDRYKREGYIEYASSILKPAQTQVQQKTSLSISIAISDIIEDLSSLPNVKKDVISLMKFRFIYGDNQIFTRELEGLQLLERNNNKDEKNISGTVKKLMVALENVNEQHIQVQLAQLNEELKILNTSKEIERFIESLRVQVTQFCIKHSTIGSSEYIHLIDGGKELDKVGNFEELQLELERWFLSIIKLIDEEKSYDQIEEAKEWIIAHLQQHITIEKIAAKVYMNPTYFCEYFKNETGETVLEFVTRSRIHKARELLLTSNLKVYEIAEQVGYSDTKYFSKLFKKYYGELPSKYKERVKVK
ncbi:response regulator transcription factor [Halalkalibacter alkalisediminis]|uniref:Helix-turn-helix domain-containing protein n=1 Tax=Halalkalibacter alkalisediminis TaxID=935616 RepID=A0ABV6NKG5_9BACI|nr:helix-turn-helix domain-containing protein [Halalkalibacter alkalisediminis]